MSRLADIYKAQKAKGGGLGSTLKERIKEKYDPRQILNQSGLLVAMFPGLKKFRSDTSIRPEKTSSSELSPEIIDVFKIINVNTAITAKNTMALPIMSRELNVIRQGIIKLVKVWGDKQYNKTDAFFKTSAEHEKEYESSRQFRKFRSDTEKSKKEKAGGNKKSDGGLFSGIISGIISGLMPLLLKGGLIAGALYGFKKYFEDKEFQKQIDDLVKGAFDGIIKVMKDHWEYVVGALALAFPITTLRLIGSGIKLLAPLLSKLGLGLPTVALGIGLGAKAIKKDKARLNELSKIESQRQLTPEEIAEKQNLEKNTLAGSLSTSTVNTGVAVGGAVAGGIGVKAATKIPELASKTGTAILDAKTTTIQSVAKSTPTTKWGRFLKFLATRNSKLFQTVGKKLAQSAALMAVPFAGWIGALLNIGVSLWSIYDLYELWKEFNNVDTDENIENETLKTEDSSILEIPNPEPVYGEEPIGGKLETPSYSEQQNRLRAAATTFAVLNSKDPNSEETRKARISYETEQRRMDNFRAMSDDTSGPEYDSQKITPTQVSTSASVPTATGAPSPAPTPASVPTASPSKMISQSGSVSEALSFFENKGWTKEQAAGIVGNLMAESGTSLKTDAVGDGGKAYGIAQWHPPRQKNFEKVFGKDIRSSSFKEQLEFVNWELNNTEKTAGNLLKQSTTPEQAASIVDQFYERSSGVHRQKRVEYAKNVYQGKKVDSELPYSTTPSVSTSDLGIGSAAGSLTTSSSTPNLMEAMKKTLGNFDDATLNTGSSLVNFGGDVLKELNLGNNSPAGQILKGFLDDVGGVDNLKSLTGKLSKDIFGNNSTDFIGSLLSPIGSMLENVSSASKSSTTGNVVDNASRSNSWEKFIESRNQLLPLTSQAQNNNTGAPVERGMSLASVDVADSKMMSQLYPLMGLPYSLTGRF